MNPVHHLLEGAGQWVGQVRLVQVDPAHPLDYGKPEVPVTPAEQKAGFELSGKLNKLRAQDYPGDAALDTQALEHARSYQPGFTMGIGYRFQDKSAVELNWMYLTSQIYSVSATLAPPNFIQLGGCV